MPQPQNEETAIQKLTELSTQFKQAAADILTPRLPHKKFRQAISEVYKANAQTVEAAARTLFSENPLERKIALTALLELKETFDIKAGAAQEYNNRTSIPVADPVTPQGYSRALKEVLTLI